MPLSGSGGLPTIRSPQDFIREVKKWQTKLNPLVTSPRTPPAPFNFAGTRARGGITLAWAQVNGADGYEILRSDNGDFSNPTIIPIRNPAQTSYFDAFTTAGGTGTVTKWYRIRATNGTFSQPGSAKGVLSGIVKQTSIDPTDTVTAASTVFDQSTTDKTQAIANWGRRIVGPTVF